MRIDSACLPIAKARRGIFIRKQSTMSVKIIKLMLTVVYSEFFMRKHFHPFLIFVLLSCWVPIFADDDCADKTTDGCPTVCCNCYCNVPAGVKPPPKGTPCPEEYKTCTSRSACGYSCKIGDSPAQCIDVSICGPITITQDDLPEGSDLQCKSGQGLMEDQNGTLFCVDPGSGQCYKTLDATNNQDPYTDGACSVCGYYPASKCPSCGDGQTKQTINNQDYCIDDKTGVCYSVLDWSGGTASQPKDPSCTACGVVQSCTEKDGSTSCVGNCCPSGQTLQTIDGQSFCTDDATGQCSTMAYVNGVAATQKAYSGDPCSDCSYYPSSNCPSCSDGQTKQTIDKKDYCVDDKTSVCHGELSWSDNKSYQSLDPSCSVCGLADDSLCCASGQTLQTVDGQSFCTDDATGQCSTMVYVNGVAATQKAYSGKPCSDCSYYPSSNCPSCLDGQTKQTIDKKDYCVDDKTSVCHGELSWSDNKSYQSLDPSCSVCGLADDSLCCASGQTLQTISDTESFCTVSDGKDEGKCYTMLYEQGVAVESTAYTTNSCAGHGYYPASKAPPFCLENQTKKEYSYNSFQYCVEDKVCYTMATFNNDLTIKQEKDDTCYCEAGQAFYKPTEDDISCVTLENGVKYKKGRCLNPLGPYATEQNVKYGTQCCSTSWYNDSYTEQSCQALTAMYQTTDDDS